ncbi:MAG: hypothetical protein ACOCXJ_08160, partial [Planctomycetota bacterium]
MTDQYFARVHGTTPTRAWVNNPSVEDVKRAISLDITRGTTNPAFASKVVPALPEADRNELLSAALQAESDLDRAV